MISRLFVIAWLFLQPPRPRVLGLLACCLLLLLPLGCNRSSSSTPPGFTGMSTEPARDSFDLALDFLQRMDQFEPEQARGQIAYHLNRWIERQPPDSQWIADPLVGRLPLEIRNLPPLQDLSQLQFGGDDVHALEEALWMRDVSQWVAQQSPSPELVAAGQQLQPRLGPTGMQQLVVAERLFDWTVRNIQLDPLLPYPRQAAAGPQASPGEGPAEQRLPPPARAVAGPGYTLYPRQVLMYGRGDAWQRARVFILLARQQGIEAVMLGFDNPRQSPRARPWLPAVLIEDQLFLLDSRLGLPLPGPQGQPIATLQQVLDQPELLGALDVPPHDYGVTADDFQHLVALVDAAPQYLSQRMKLLQQRLPADDSMVLTTSPSQTAKRLRQCPAITQVALWTLPYETYWFRTALMQQITRDQQARRQFLQREALFQGLNPLVTARQRHFRGQFDNSPDQQGAKSGYLQTRLPDETIRRIETDRQVQQELGVSDQLSDNPAARQQSLRQLKQFYVQAKLHASYWLGLAHFETGNYDVAAQWFDRHTLQAAPEGSWTDGARYNLARSYEALGQWDKARQLYLEDESPQQHGNHLRALRLPAASHGGDEQQD